MNRYGVPVSQGLLGKPRAQRRASVGGKWSAEEDAMLKDIVQQHGPKSWKKVCTIVHGCVLLLVDICVTVAFVTQVANLLGKTRTDVQCLHRWNKVLRVRYSIDSENCRGVFKPVSPCCALMFMVCTVCIQPGLQKGSWSKEEDQVVKAMVSNVM